MYSVYKINNWEIYLISIASSPLSHTFSLSLFLSLSLSLSLSLAPSSATPDPQWVK